MLPHGCALRERSSSGIWKRRTSSFKWYVTHSNTTYSSGIVDVPNWVHLFESPSIGGVGGWNNSMLSDFVTGNTRLRMRQPSHNISLINDDYVLLSKPSHQVLCFPNQVQLKHVKYNRFIFLTPNHYLISARRVLFFSTWGNQMYLRNFGYSPARKRNCTAKVRLNYSYLLLNMFHELNDVNTTCVL